MKMYVSFTEKNSVFHCGFSVTNSVFHCNYGAVHEITKILNESYKGDYEVTPKVVEQTLKTKEKFMHNDVLIHSVPVYEVANTSGGTTVYIAKE